MSRTAGWGALLSALLAAGGLGGCGKPPTRVVVVIDAQPQVRAQARSLLLEVRKIPEVDGLPTAPLPSAQDQDTIAPRAGEPLFPTSALLEPKEGTRYYELRVRALTGMGRLLVVQGLRGTFVEGKTRLVRLLLVDGCLGVDCSAADATGPVCGCPGGGEALNCMMPVCTDSADVGEGDDYVPDEVYACDGGRSAASCRPAPLVDAGTDGAPDGATDAGMDAGTDGAPDGATDAGMDAATPDAATDAGMDAAPDGPPPMPSGGCTSPYWSGVSGTTCLEAPGGCSPALVDMGRDTLPACTPDSACSRPVCTRGGAQPRFAYDVCATPPGETWRCQPGGTCGAGDYSSGDMPSGWPPETAAMAMPPDPGPGVGPQFGAAVALAPPWVAASEWRAPPAMGAGGGGEMPPEAGRVVLFRAGIGPSSGTFDTTEVARFGPSESAGLGSPPGGEPVPDVAAPMAFGRAVAMVDRGEEVLLAVGAPRASATGRRGGAVLIYAWPAGAGPVSSPPALRQVLWSPAGAVTDAFGQALAMRAQDDGTLRLMVGMPQSSIAGPGAVFVYRFDATAGRFLPEVEWRGAGGGARAFGSAVALDGSRLYAAGFATSGEALLAVLEPDGSGGWSADDGDPEASSSALCASRSMTMWYPPLQLSADEGVVALLQGYLEEGGYSRHEGSVHLWERWEADSGSPGWHGPRLFAKSGLDATYVTLARIDSVSVASGRLEIGGMAQEPFGTRDVPTTRVFAQALACPASPCPPRWAEVGGEVLSPWQVDFDGDSIPDIDLHAPTPGFVAAVAQLPGHPGRWRAYGLVAPEMAGDPPPPGPGGMPAVGAVRVIARQP